MEKVAGKKLVIVGASGLGREVCDIARAIGWEVKGFLDSREGILAGMEGLPPILGAPEGYTASSDEVFVVAVGEPEARHKYVSLIREGGGDFATLVHPTAVLGQGVELGEGVVVHPQAVLGSRVRVGSHVVIGVQTSVGHDCELGDFVTLSPGCTVAGWVTLRSGCFLGVHSAVIPHVCLGGAEGGVFVAAGAVVTKSFASGRVMGVPAKIAYPPPPQRLNRFVFLGLPARPRLDGFGKGCAA